MLGSGGRLRRPLNNLSVGQRDGERRRFVKLVRYFEEWSVALRPYRWWFGGGSAALIATIVFAGQQQALSSRLGSVVFAFLWFALMWAWGGVCLVSWFHPTRGTMRHGSPWWFGLPGFIQSFLRGYAAVFLAIWFVLSVLFLALLCGMPLCTAAR